MEKNSKPLGTIMCMTVNDFFAEYLKSLNGQLDNFQLLVVSKDITTKKKVREGNMIRYSSMFDNIDFCPELFPNANCIEYAFSTTNKTYAGYYTEQLGMSLAGRIICSIVDLLLDGVNVYLVCSKGEQRSFQYFDILKDYLFEHYGVIMHDLEEYQDDPDCLKETGDRENITNLLEYKINELKLIDEELGVFFNKFTKGMVNQYRNVLMSKSIGELVEIGKKHNVYVNKHKPKDYIVDLILEAFIGNIDDGYAMDPSDGLPFD